MHTTILLSIAIFILAIFLILLLVVLKKRKEKSSETLTQGFENMIKENKLIIHYKDVFKKKMICFDKTNKKLLLLDVCDKKMECCISLDEIYSCRIIQLKDKFSNCTKILLEIVYKENAETITFCFYDKSRDDVRERTCLLLKAQHWNQRINYHKKFWWVNSDVYTS